MISRLKSNVINMLIMKNVQERAMSVNSMLTKTILFLDGEARVDMMICEK